MSSTPDLPTLIKASLVPAQFETISPVLDGNGRLGRLPIVVLPRAEGMSSEPSLSQPPS